MAKRVPTTATRPSGWSVLWGLTRPYRSRMVLLGITSFAGAMLEAGFLVLLTSSVLALAGGSDTIGPIMGQSLSSTIALWIAAVLVVVRLVLSLVTVHISAALGAFVRTDQRLRVTHAYLRANWGTQQAEAAGRLQELLTSFVGRINAAMTSLTLAITASLSLLAFLSAGVLVDPIATVAVLGALIILGLGLAPIRRRIRGVAGKSASSDLTFATTVAELGALGQEMQTFGVRDAFETRLSEVVHATTAHQRRVQVLSGTLSPVYTFLAYAAVIGGVALLQVLGVGDLAAIGSIALLMLRSLSYGQQLLAVSGALAAAMPSLERVDETVDFYQSRPADTGHVQPDGVTPLSFDGVGFAYTDERPALSGVELTIGTGEMLGVIGPSGAGKSTLAQLVLGLRQPTVGTITVDGTDLRAVDREWWTQRVAYVPQDAALFTGTVAENIRFFREGLDDAALERAASQANFLKDVTGLPKGFDTHLGERGSQLSGGQRQRLSIARALVGEPELLVLDEPTSALDGQSEALIRETLAGLHGRVTVVIIAHRMSTLDLCDRIAVVEDGRLTGLGPPEAVHSTNARICGVLAPDADEKAVEAGIQRFRAQNGRDPIVAVVPGQGVVAVGRNPNAAKTALETFLDALKVARDAERIGTVRVMDQRERSFIENWEAEAYRRQVADA